LSVAEGAVSQSTIDESALDAINQALAAKDTGAAIQTLGTIAKQHGMSDLARTCGVARESLYRSLSSDGNPELVTFLSVLQAMGLKMIIGKVR
jgi:probable addiction module antidote protein